MQGSIRPARIESRNAAAVRPKIDDMVRLLDVAVEALVVLDAGAAIHFWSAGAQALFGYASEQAGGRTLADLLGPGAALRQDTTHQLKARGEWSGELFCVAADSRVLQVECRCAAHLDSRGRIAAIYCAMTDVTEQRRAEKEIVLLRNVMEQRIQRRTAELHARK
jgi:PAS domain S-box-containing protein